MIQIQCLGCLSMTHNDPASVRLSRGVLNAYEVMFYCPVCSEWKSQALGNKDAVRMLDQGAIVPEAMQAIPAEIAAPAPSRWHC